MIKYTMLFVVLFFSYMGTSQHIQELGQVEWDRDYDIATKKSKENGLPIFLLFQEVPGCSTCRNYGDQVLSDPLLVDLIKNYFVPLAIFNNKGGKDKEILEKYKEPTWNNPVVRIVDENGENLVKRLSGDYSKLGVLQAIKSSFIARSMRVPQNVLLLEDILTTQPDAELTCSMFCFWSGEKAFGKIEGVYQTEAGWQNGKEVVKINFDSDKVSEKELIKRGKQVNCADQVMETDDSFRLDKDPKYYLKNSKYRVLAMHPLQAARINSLLGEGQSDVSEWLFPSQLFFLEKHKDKGKGESLYQTDFDIAWKSMIDKI